VNGRVVQFKSKSVEDPEAPVVIPDPERIAVVAVRGMDVYAFRRHIAKRHPRVRYGFISHHDHDHLHNPSLDHNHKEELL
jgi:hypothetical protein